MKLFDVFDDRFNKKVYEDRMVKKFLNSIKKHFVVINDGYKFSGNLDLRNWVLKDLSRIKKWLGGDLVEVDGDVSCNENKNLKSLGGCGLRRTNGSLYIWETDISDLGDLEYVGGKFSCDKDKVEYFLERYSDVIGLSLFFYKKGIIKLKDNKYKYNLRLDLYKWPYKDLSRVRGLLGGDLVEVGGDVSCNENEILKSLGGCGLRRVKGILNIKKSNIDNLGELEYLGKEFYCDEDKVEYFKNSRWGEVLKLR